MNASVSTTRLVEAPPAVRDLARRLLAQGATNGFTQRVVARVDTLRRTSDGAHPLDLAANVIGASFPRFVLPAGEGAAALIAVHGAPRSGRSAFVRKLALRLVAARRRVSIVAVRQRESSKPEWLATWANELGASACVLDESSEVPRRLLAGADVVLVDGSGDVERDRAVESTLVERAGSVASSITRVGTLAADLGVERLRADVRALGSARAACAVVTRLDLASAPAAALEVASSAGLRVAFVCDGAAEERHLHRASAEAVANVFLKGRIQ